MIVVSDTSPLNYLVLIDTVHVLPILFKEVYIPRQVATDLMHADAPQAVRSWIATPPDWLLIRAPSNVINTLNLDPGETHAIALAEELHADHILIDEWSARGVAAARGLHVIGTLGVLDQAAERKLINLPQVLARLSETSFRIDRQFIDALLQRDQQRRGGQKDST